MRIDILSAVPALLSGLLDHSIMQRARKRGFLEIIIHDIRDYTVLKHKQIDDYQYGGGAGMVMMAEPIAAVIEHLQAQRNYDDIIYLSPDGERWQQSLANRYSLKQNIMLLCGHYKGVDQRIREHFITKEISIGDYVLSGGEIAAAVVVDSIGRLIPGVLNDETSALSDSFQDGLLAPPVYTRPPEFRGWKVPNVLLSGNHEAIDKWRLEQSIERTRLLRPDLLDIK
jgi:tRNA (guanine37-N1)-methyltransferase